MIYFVVILGILFVVVVGVIVYFVWHKAQREVNPLLNRQAERKLKRLNAVEAFVTEKGKVTNDDVQALLSVSDATAERYLDELEKAGKLTQHGTTGQNVYYTPK